MTDQRGNRKDYNEKIAALLLRFLAAHPELRFTQALRALSIVMETPSDGASESGAWLPATWQNLFSEESEVTYRRVEKAMLEMCPDLLYSSARYGFMCETDFFHELGESPICSIGSFPDQVTHGGGCGVVRVKVEYLETVKPSRHDLMEAENEKNEEAAEIETLVELDYTVNPNPPEEAPASRTEWGEVRTAELRAEDHDWSVIIGSVGGSVVRACARCGEVMTTNNLLGDCKTPPSRK